MLNTGWDLDKVNGIFAKTQTPHGKPFINSGMKVLIKVDKVLLINN